MTPSSGDAGGAATVDAVAAATACAAGVGAAATAAEIADTGFAAARGADGLPTPPFRNFITGIRARTMGVPTIFENN